MTAAQQRYFTAHGIDPFALEWGDADALGFAAFGKSEAAILPDGRVLLANGSPASRDSRLPEETA